MSQKQNNDFLYSVQIPNFLSPEKCDELLKDIMESEQDVIGCVGDEKGQNAVIPEIRKTNEWYFMWARRKSIQTRQTKQRLEMVTEQNVSNGKYRKW